MQCDAINSYFSLPHVRNSAQPFIGSNTGHSSPFPATVHAFEFVAWSSAVSSPVHSLASSCACTRYCYNNEALSTSSSAQTRSPLRRLELAKSTFLLCSTILLYHRVNTCGVPVTRILTPSRGRISYRRQFSPKRGRHTQQR